MSVHPTQHPRSPPSSGAWPTALPSRPGPRIQRPGGHRSLRVWSELGDGKSLSGHRVLPAGQRRFGSHYPFLVEVCSSDSAAVTATSEDRCDQPVDRGYCANEVDQPSIVPRFAWSFCAQPCRLGGQRRSLAYADMIPSACPKWALPRCIEHRRSGGAQKSVSGAGQWRSAGLARRRVIAQPEVAVSGEAKTPRKGPNVSEGLLRRTLSAHLLMMRSSEEKYWANANQHRSVRMPTLAAKMTRTAEPGEARAVREGFRPIKSMFHFLFPLSNIRLGS
jgi:hypothetical protein